MARLEPSSSHLAHLALSTPRGPRSGGLVLSALPTAALRVWACEPCARPCPSDPGDPEPGPRPLVPMTSSTPEGLPHRPPRAREPGLHASFSLSFPHLCTARPQGPLGGCPWASRAHVGHRAQRHCPDPGWAVTLGAPGGCISPFCTQGLRAGGLGPRVLGHFVPVPPADGRPTHTERGCG